MRNIITAMLKKRNRIKQGRIHITDVQSGQDGTRSWVQAQVNDSLLWFESHNTKLVAAPEAFAGLFLLPAAMAQVELEIDAPLSATWQYNVDQVLATFQSWLQSSRKVNLKYAEHSAPPAPTVSSDRTGLCFSGGVDSFYSLLTYRDQIDALVFVRGFDMSLKDTERFQEFEDGLHRIGEALGVQSIVLSTNLRKHPQFAPFPWEMTHGAALAAAGHLLHQTLGQLFISASFPQAYLKPWGSHPSIDPHWSSEYMTIAHVGDEQWRTDKLIAIADEPLVQQHLRVCWENRSVSGNCGCCEKCVRTMLVLATIDKLEHFSVFADAHCLADHVRSLGSLKQLYIPVYETFLTHALPADVNAALRELLKASKAAVK